MRTYNDKPSPRKFRVEALPIQDRERIIAGQRRLLERRREAQLPVGEGSIANLLVLEEQIASEAKVEGQAQ